MTRALLVVMLLAAAACGGDDSQHPMTHPGWTFDAATGEPACDGAAVEGSGGQRFCTWSCAEYGGHTGLLVVAEFYRLSEVPPRWGVSVTTSDQSAQCQ